MNKFLDKNNFKPLGDLEKFNLNFKGLYALMVKDIHSLPIDIRTEMNAQNNTIIYIGKAEDRNLNERLQEECRGKSHGTFFRGIGALLNFKPDKGSLIGYRNKNNYKFNDSISKEIVNWMNVNLLINFIKLDSEFYETEKQLIYIHRPILNTTHNPNKSKILALKRKNCRDYASK